MMHTKRFRFLYLSNIYVLPGSDNLVFNLILNYTTNSQETSDIAGIEYLAVLSVRALLNYLRNINC